MLTTDYYVSIYGFHLWKFIPYQWINWWFDKVKEIEGCSRVTLDSPKPYFVEIYLDIGSFKADIESVELGKLIYGVNKFLLTNLLCPWVCTIYIQMSSNIKMDIVIKHFLRKALLAMPNDHDKC